MKKLILLFSAILISGFSSAQSADGKFESGYSKCFEQEAGVAPKKIPMVADWQTKDEVIKDESIGNYGNGVQISRKTNSGGKSFSNGCKQGKIDSLAYLNSSQNSATDKSKKKM